MTAVAGVGGQAVRVAKGTLVICTLMVHGKGVRTIIRCRFPCAGGMTDAAFSAELTEMFGGFGMASHTFLWRSFKYIVLMTRFALHICVCAIQFEGGEVMVEGGGRPAVG